MHRRTMLMAGSLACAALNPGARAAFAGARAKIVMTTVVPKDDSPLGQLLYTIYREAFGRLDLDLEYVYQPPRRGEVDADVGNVDGELGRGPDYGADHPMLVRVDEAALTLTVSAFALDPAIRVQGWDSLKASRYRIEYRMGLKLPERQLAAAGKQIVVSAVPTSLQGLKKLVAGRTDIYVDLEEYVADLLREQPFPHSERIVKAGTLNRLPIHVYLNRKHAALAPRLAAVLRAMKKEGLIERYRAQIAAHGAQPRQ